MRDVVVIGAGGFGREVLDVIDAINEREPSWKAVGVADDSPTATNLTLLEQRAVHFLGKVDDLASLAPSCMFVIGVGAPAPRALIAAKLEHAGLEAATLVHPAATVGRNTAMGPGTVLCAGARLTTNVVLGRHVHVNLNATVGHDSSIGDFVSINPLGSVSGDCIVEDRVSIGVGAVVLNGLCVGREATVGGAACVVRDVPNGTTVKGVPAR